MLIINHFCDGNKAEFARKVNELPQTVNGWLNRNVGRSITNKIIKSFPEVNEAWLLTGKGQMSNSDQPQPQEPSFDNEPAASFAEDDAKPSLYLQLFEEYEKYTARLKSQHKKDIAKLKAEIEQLKRELAKSRLDGVPRDKEHLA